MPNLPISGLPISTDPRSDDLYPIAENSTGTRITKQINRINNNKKILEATAKTANYTLQTSDEVILFNTTNGNLIASLPSAAGIKGKIFEIHKIGASNTLTITPAGAETVGGNANYVLSENYSSILIISNNSNWLISAIGTQFSGNVINNGVSTDDALVKFDGTTGKLVQNSNAILSDAGQLDISNLVTDYIQIDTAATAPAIVEGTLGWNGTDGSLELGFKGGNVSNVIGQDLHVRVTNAEATTLNKGEVVYLFGASGNRASVKRASNTSDTTSAKTLGIVAESISSNQTGFVITQGVIDGLNLGAPFVDGDILWLDSTAGQFTRTKPVQPNHLVFIGVVERANAGNGQIYVKPQNGYELDEIHDVLISNPANGNLLIRDQTNQLWKNANLTAGSNITITNAAGAVTIATTNPGVSDGDKGDISVSGSGSTWTIDNGTVSTSKLGGDITTAGKALLDDADAAAQRTTLGLGTLATQSGTFSGTSSGTNTGDQNLFSTIAVAGQSNVIADSTSDTLTLVAGTNISITTNATTDTITINSTGGGGGISDGDKGDISVSGSGTIWTIDSGAVSTSKLGGDITTAGKALLDDADAAAQRTTLGLGTLATQSGTFSGTSSGTNTGDQTITLTGDVTGTGTGSFAATIANGAVSTSKLGGDITTAGKALLDDADAAAQRTTLGLGTLATQSGTFSGTSSGTNTGDQNLFSTIAVAGQSNVIADGTSDTLTLVAGTNVTITTDATTDTITINSTGGGGGISDGDKGDISVSGSGTIWTIDNQAVTYAKIQNITNNRLLGRANGTSGTMQEITLGSNLSLSGTTLNASVPVITSGTAAPSGGNDGDIYLQYT